MIRMAIISALVLSFRCGLAQTSVVSGLYQIVSGSYVECCGFIATPTVYPLPNTNQSFVRLTINQQSDDATMTFLTADASTVFSIVPCSPSGAINFSFGYGFAFSNSIIFHVDPGPPPYGEFWNYTASNSSTGLQINGVLGTLQSGCADVPTQFTHSNVVAVLVPPPRIKLLGFSGRQRAQIFVQGTAGMTNVIEASSDLSSWIPLSTNVMDYSLCPICPYVIFEDTQSLGLSRRFYRVFELH